MATLMVVNASSLAAFSSKYPSHSTLPSSLFSTNYPSNSLPFSRRKASFFKPSFAVKKMEPCQLDTETAAQEETNEGVMVKSSTETLLHSFSPLPLLYLAALPGAGAVRSLFGPFAEIVKTFNLPDWLVHWGHPGNMAVVLFAMGGYGTYLGFRIKFSDDVEEKAKAKDLHPKLLAGMFFFFALGATGGVTSLLTSDRPIFESPHAITGIIGLTLLTIQTLLPTLFEGNPGLRNVHGLLGSGIMTLFVVHAALGLQLGLSY